LWVNSGQNGAGEYSTGWGPNYQNVLKAFLFQKTTNAIPARAQGQRNNGVHVDGIPIYVVTSNATDYRFGQYEFTVNAISAGSNITSWVITGSFKVGNGTTTLTTPTKTVIGDQNGGLMDIDVEFSTVVGNDTFLSVVVTGLNTTRVVWNIAGTIHASLHDISVTW